MNRFFLISVCVMVFVTSCSQSQLRYPVTGVFKGEAAQGMAIWGNNAYLFSNGGRCRVYNLKMQRVIGEFMLQSASSRNHANTASFGCEIPEGGDRPALYITECYGEHRLFVENVTQDNAKLVQVIQAIENGKVMRVSAWAVDTENKFLYGFTDGGKTGAEDGSKYNLITKFRLPCLDEGDEVIFTENDILEQFTVIFPNITQGVTLKGHYLYMITGDSESSSNRQNYHRSLKVIDLRNKELKKSIDLTYVTTSEPEDIDFYRGKMLMYCGGDGGLYEIKYK